MNKSLTACLMVAIGTGVTPVMAKSSAQRYRIVSRMVLGSPGQISSAQCLTMDSDKGRLYVAGTRSVIIVDVKKHIIAGVVPLPERVHCVALAPKRGKGYATIWQPNLVAVIDLKTMKTVETVKVQTIFRTGWWPKAIVYEPETDRLFTFNDSSGDCTAIDARTNKVLDQIPLGGIPGFAVTNGNGMVYANITQTNEMVAIDAKTLTVVKRWPMVWGTGPNGLAIDLQHRRLFSACANGRLVVSDPVTGKAIVALPIGRGAGAVAYDAGKRLLFSANGADATVSVIQVRGPDDFWVTASAPTLWGAEDLALDSRTHHLFLVASTSPTTPGPYSGPGFATLIELAPG